MNKLTHQIGQTWKFGCRFQRASLSGCQPCSARCLYEVHFLLQELVSWYLQESGEIGRGSPWHHLRKRLKNRHYVERETIHLAKRNKPMIDICFHLSVPKNSDANSALMWSFTLNISRLIFFWHSSPNDWKFWIAKLLVFLFLKLYDGIFFLFFFHVFITISYIEEKELKNVTCG